MEPNKICSFRNEYAYLSNFYTCPIRYMGMDFPCVESAFQAAKCGNAADMGQFQYMTAKEAKRHGRLVPLKENWEVIKADILLELLFIKFGSHPELMRQLLATGDAELVEGNVWHDNYWGRCTCGRPECAGTPGENMLGKLLMSVRDTFRNHFQQNCTSMEALCREAASAATVNMQDNYVPRKGWFDLSRLNLPRYKFKVYAKLQELGQHYQDNIAYVKLHNAAQLEKVKDACAEMQMDLILNYNALEIE